MRGISVGIGAIAGAAGAMSTWFALWVSDASPFMAGLAVAVSAASGAIACAFVARFPAQENLARSGWSGEPLNEVAQAVAGLGRAVAELEESSERMASGAVAQTETITRAASTVEALSDRIDRISRHADQAADVTERARVQSRHGMELIQQLIEGMERLREHSSASASRARRLGERSDEIGSIVDLLSEVSDRTDLLALNASIESVRAGEHGRGFALVADEIRKLAERASAATREISGLVCAIQADAHEGARSLAEQESLIELESRAVREAGTALECISRVADDSARIVEEISFSAGEQVEVTQAMVDGMRRISDVSKEIYGESGRIRRTTHGLAVGWRQAEALMGGPPSVGAELSTLHTPRPVERSNGSC